MSHSRATLKVILFTLIAVAGCHAVALADDLVLSGPMTISGDTTFDNVTIQAGGELTANALITVLGDMQVDSGGVVTHSLRNLNGLQLDISGMLDVSIGGSIGVSSRGLRGGRNGSSFGDYGETFDTSGQIVAGANGRVCNNSFYLAGASYGGVAVNPGCDAFTNSLYGVLEDPILLGSGGGGDYQDGYGYWEGNHGGGRITITAGTFNIDGVVRADGGSSAYGEGGGGSGGSIKISAGTVSGSGEITARGGRGYHTGGHRCSSGGGGRIAIYYDALTFPVANISAASRERPDLTGSAGTIYLKDNAQAAGVLVIDNDWSSSTRYTSVYTDLSVIGQLVVTSEGRLQSTTDGVVSLPTFDSISVQVGGYLVGGAHPIVVTGDLRVDSGGVCTHPLRYFHGLRLDVNGTVDIIAGGSIDATAKGLRGGRNGSSFGDNGETYDTSGQIVSGAIGQVCNNSFYLAGASYGGIAVNPGCDAFTNSPYGVLEDPVLLGSGGGGDYQDGYGYWRGNHGGGRVTITAGTLNVDGAIRADGGSSANGEGGGGSGGSIKVVAGTVSGSGEITARGGAGYSTGGHRCSSGGGGRIAIFYDAMIFPVVSISAASLPHTDLTGSAGSVYLKDNANSAGWLIVDNNGEDSNRTTPLLTDLLSLLDLTVKGNSELDLRSEIEITGELTVEPGSAIGND